MLEADVCINPKKKKKKKESKCHFFTACPTSKKGERKYPLLVFITIITHSKKPHRSKQKYSEMAQVLPLRQNVVVFLGKLFHLQMCLQGPTCALK